MLTTAYRKTAGLIRLDLGTDIHRSRAHFPAVWHTHKESFTYNYNLWSVDPVEDWHQLFYVLIVGAVAILVSAEKADILMVRRR